MRSNPSHQDSRPRSESSILRVACPSPPQTVSVSSAEHTYQEDIQGRPSRTDFSATLSDPQFLERHLPERTCRGKWLREDRREIFYGENVPSNRSMNL